MEADFLRLAGTGEGAECGAEGWVGERFCHQRQTTAQGIYKWSHSSHYLKPNVLAQGKFALIIQHLNTESGWAHIYIQSCPASTNAPHKPPTCTHCVHYLNPHYCACAGLQWGLGMTNRFAREGLALHVTRDSVRSRKSSRNNSVWWWHIWVLDMHKCRINRLERVVATLISSSLYHHWKSLHGCNCDKFNQEGGGKARENRSLRASSSLIKIER